MSDDFLDRVRERRTSAATAVDEQVKLLRSMGGREMSGTNALTREVAILEMCLQRERAADEMVSVVLIRSALESVASETTRSADLVAQRIDAFTTATKASTDQLARWTKVLAYATIALALFAVAQVIVALLK